MPSDYEFHLPQYKLDHVEKEERTDSEDPRTFRMSSDGWASLQRGLYKKFSSGASLILYEMGLAYGSFLSTTPQGEVRSLSEVMMENRWGSVSIIGGAEAVHERVYLVVKDCVFCTRHGRIDSADGRNCDFMKGVAVSFVSRLYSREYKATCICSYKDGFHACRIELVPK